MDCIENCGYDNLSLSRVMDRVFSLKSTPLNIWIMQVYIVWVETWCIRYDKLAKQNFSRVSCGKTLPVRHLRKPVVTTCHDSSHSSHVLSTCFTLQECFLRATYENFLDLQFALSHSLSHTIFTMKSHIKYKVQKIEQNYNQIWHEIKPNTNQL